MNTVENQLHGIGAVYGDVYRNGIGKPLTSHAICLFYDLRQVNDGPALLRGEKKFSIQVLAALPRVRQLGKRLNHLGWRLD